LAPFYLFEVRNCPRDGTGKDGSAMDKPNKKMPRINERRKERADEDDGKVRERRKRMAMNARIGSDR
jgi:hypothetical protein